MTLVLTSPVFLRQVRKPPDVAEAYGVTDGRQQERQLAVTGFSVVFSRFRSEYRLPFAGAQLTLHSTGGLQDRLHRVHRLQPL